MGRGGAGGLGDGKKGGSFKKWKGRGWGRTGDQLQK